MLPFCVASGGGHFMIHDINGHSNHKLQRGLKGIYEVLSINTIGEIHVNICLLSLCALKEYV